MYLKSAGGSYCTNTGYFIVVYNMVITHENPTFAAYEVL